MSPTPTFRKKIPYYSPDATSYSFDIAAAGKLLDQAGWKDIDNDPATPRQAWGVPGIPSGTPFEVNYVTTNAVQRQQVSTILAGSLAQCGIKVNVQYLDANTLYAPGPAGILFGRNFDMVEFAMGTTGIEPPCDWFTSSQVPEAANNWVGTNVSGYSNPAFIPPACHQSKPFRMIPFMLPPMPSYSRSSRPICRSYPSIGGLKLRQCARGCAIYPWTRPLPAICGILKLSTLARVVNHKQMVVAAGL